MFLHNTPTFTLTKADKGEQGWRSGESARLPPMWPGFESWRQRHMWVEFVVGSLPCSERFFAGYSGFPLSLKTNTQIPIRSGTHGHVSTSSYELLSDPWVNKLQFTISFFLLWELKVEEINQWANKPSLFQFKFVSACCSWLSISCSCPSTRGNSTSRSVSLTLLYQATIRSRFERNLWNVSLRE